MACESLSLQPHTARALIEESVHFVRGGEDVTLYMVREVHRGLLPVPGMLLGTVSCPFY